MKREKLAGMRRRKLTLCALFLVGSGLRSQDEQVNRKVLKEELY